MTAHELFTTDVTGLLEASRPEVIRLHDGGHLDLRISPVRKRIADSSLRMLAYNGSIPGPTLHVDQGSQITVQVTNGVDVAATVHWHGIRCWWRQCLHAGTTGTSGTTGRLVLAPAPIAGVK